MKLEHDTVLPEVLQPILKELTILRNHLHLFITHICGENAVIVKEFETNFRQEPKSTYLDDGNTSTPGTEYHFLYVIPIMRDSVSLNMEYMGWYHGNATSALLIESHALLRTLDNKIKYKGCAIYVSPLEESTNRKYSPERVYCDTHGMIPHLTYSPYMAMAFELNKLMEEYKRKVKVDSFVKQHLNWIGG